jgi:hypothetical protein
MTDSTRQQFEEADEAIDRAIVTFIGKIKSTAVQWEAVAPAYVVERALLLLCEEMAKLIDDPGLANLMGPAMVKLSNSLAASYSSRRTGLWEHCILRRWLAQLGRSWRGRVPLAAPRHFPTSV